MSGKRSGSHSNARRKVSRAASISSVLVLLFCIFLLGVVANRITATDRPDDSSSSGYNCREGAERLLQVKGNPDMHAVDVVYKGMTVSFNPKAHIPNWVAWELTADEA
ncbi:MAG: hypothetical protein K2M76_04525, partial [Muribaculaceae bacterium]|nr:hypothetical protein [Muribaculaceae bacterium]